MLPTSIAGSMRIACAVDECRPPRRVRTSARVEREVAAGLDAAQVEVGPVGADDVAAVRRRAVVEQDRHVGADRPDEPGRAEPLGDLVLARAGGTSAPSALRSLISLTRWSPRTSTSTSPPALGRRPGRPSAARPRARRGAPATASIVVSAGRLRPPRRVERGSGSVDGLRVGAARPRRSRRSPARARRRSRPRRTAPCTRARRVPPIIPTSDSTRYHSQPAAVEDPVVGADVLLVARRRARRASRSNV